MKSYKAVIFDLDGTLIDNAQSFRIAADRFAEHYPQIFSKDPIQQKQELIKLYSQADRRTAYHCFCRKWGWHEPPAFDTFWESWFDTYVHSAQPLPKAMETLKALQEKGIRSALITNGGTNYQSAKIASSGLSGLFEAVLISEKEGVAKPDPEIYRRCLSRLGLLAEDCLFVGDTPESDIAGSLAVGMDCLLLGDRPDSFGATYRATSVAVVLELLK